MTQLKLILDQESTLRFSIMIKVMTDQETKEYHLKKLNDLAKKSEIAQIENTTYEQKVWIYFKLSHPEAWPNPP